MKHRVEFKALKFILAILSALYPFALFFANDYSLWIVSALGVFWAIRGFFESGNFRFLSFFVALFFMLCVIFKSSNLAFLYPVLMSLLFLAVFGFSLKTEAIITKLAKLKEPNLDEKGVRYTRNLTKIWCGFFVINALICYALSLIDDKIYWSVYCGAISYMLMGALFGGEILYRKIVLKI